MPHERLSGLPFLNRKTSGPKRLHRRSLSSVAQQVTKDSDGIMKVEPVQYGANGFENSVIVFEKVLISPDVRDNVGKHGPSKGMRLKDRRVVHEVICGTRDQVPAVREARSSQTLGDVENIFVRQPAFR